MSCREVRPWLHRDAASLDETQRLRLEDHLAACARCRGDRARLRLLHRAGASLQVPPPGAREYQRAIARALIEGARTEGHVRRRRWAAPLALAAAAAAVGVAAVVATLALRGEDPPAAPAGAGDDVATSDPALAPSSPSPSSSPSSSEIVPAPPPLPSPAPAPRAPDRVEHGAVRDGAARIARGEVVPAQVLLRAAEPTGMRLASSRVVVAASAELRWLPAERTILLERGSLELESEGPASDGPGVGRIATARFEVELDGARGATALTVEATSVRLRRGTARIVDRGTRALITELGPGAAWAPAAPARPARLDPGRGSGALLAKQLLAQARARFAARDLPGAARLAEAALARAPSRPEQAEAHTLLGDVAQASGELAQAASRYGSVSTRFSDLPAAESALYAAARIELRRGRSAEARALLTRYLERYPSGRYAGDVRRQLAPLP